MVTSVATILVVVMFRVKVSLSYQMVITLIGQLSRNVIGCCLSVTDNIPNKSHNATSQNRGYQVK